MKIIKQLVLLFIFLIFNSHSSELISYSGRLTQVSGAPISGPVSLTVDVLVGVGPTLKCSHTNGAVALSNGVFHLEFDYATTCETNTKTLKTIISEAVTAGDALYIRVTDNTNTKTYPVQSITGSPLAVYALGADSVKDGSITNLSINGIAANCAAGEVMKADGTGGFTCAADATGGAGTVTGVVAGTGISVTGTATVPIVNVNLSAAEIPNLDAAKITTGTFADARIPNLNASKINAGTFVDARIPNLDASKTTSGTFNVLRIPNLDAAKITTGTLGTARIPNLDTSKITTGTFVDARIPNLDAAKVTTGTFATARIPSVTSAMITDATIVNADIGLDTITLNKLDAGVCGLGTVLSIDVAGDVVCTADTGSTNWTTSGADIYRPAGNVGIGAAPAAGNKLDVNGKLEIGSNANTDVMVIDGEREFTYSLSGTGATTSLDLTPSSDALTQRFLSPDGAKSALTISTHDTATSNYVHLVPDGGKVGIGNAAPATALDVNGTITATSLDINTTGGGGAITHANAEVGFQLNSSNLKLESIAGPRFYINRFINEALSLQLGGGDVAIGRATPGSKLDVNGTIRAPIICDETGANCKDVSTGWGAAGTVTSITAGTGLTGGTITTSGTVAVDVGTTAGKIPQLDGLGDLPASVETDPTVTAFAKAALPTCGVGEVLKGNGTNLTCVTDATITDTNTNAQTICTGATFLDGNGACTAMTVDTTIPDTNTNAQTICTGATFLDGDGNCTAMSSGADNLGNHTATTNIQLGSNYLSGDGGNEGISIDATGNVGIGNASPGHPLHVTNNQNASTYVRVSNVNNTTSAKSGFYATTSTGTGISMSVNPPNYTAVPSWANRGVIGVDSAFDGISIAAGGASSDIRFESGGVAAERMRITSAGNVGIGITNPTQKLDVVGTVKATAFVGDGSGLTNLPGGGDFKSDGSVSMTGALELANGAVATPSLTFASETDLGFFKAQSNAIGIADGGVEFARFFNGRLGIGITNPGYSLEVNKDVMVNDQSDARASLYLRNSSGGAAYGDGAGINQIFNNLEIVNYENGYLNIKTNNTEQMRILSGGNVGIGTTAPAEKLDVNGNIRVTTGNDICIQGGACLSTAATSGEANTASSAGGTSLYKTKSSSDLIFKGLTATTDLTLTANVNDVQIGVGTTNAANKLVRLDASGRYPAMDGSQITGLTDNNTTYTAGTGLDLTGTVFSIGSQEVTDTNLSGIAASCANNQILKTNGLGSFFCANQITEADVEGFLANDTTTGYVPYDNGTKLVNSNIFYNGTDTGIGTVTPDSFFHVKGGLNQWPIFERNNKKLYLNPNWSDNNLFAQIAPAAASAMGLSLSASDTVTNHLFLKTGGNVGVGTTNPGNLVDLNFTTDNGLRVKNTGASHASVYIDAGSGTAGSYIRFRKEAAEKYWINVDQLGDMRFRPNGNATPSVVFENGGDVGIGTTNPSAKLDISGSSAMIKLRDTGVGATAAAAYMEFYEAGGTRLGYVGDGSSGMDTMILNSDNGDVLLRTNTATSGLILKHTGNVGIGNTVPSSKLDVSGDITYTGVLKSNMFYDKSLSIADGWAINDYWEVVQSNPGAAGASSQWEVHISGTRGNWTEGSTYSITGTHSAGSTWREASQISDNTYVGNSKCFTVDYNSNVHDPKFRVRAVKASASCGISATMPLKVTIRSVGQNYGWTDLSATGNDATVSTFQTMGLNWSLYTGAPAAAGKLAIHADSNGLVGIGTKSPIEKLEVVGNISSKAGSLHLQRPVTGGGWARGMEFLPDGSTSPSTQGLAGIGLLGSGTTQSSLYLAFGTSPWGSSNGMHILSTGRVGIGRTNPSTALHVTGAMAATSWVGAGCEDACESSGGYSIMYPTSVAVSTFGWTTTSDRRLKEEINTLPSVTEKLKKVRGVSYFWKDREVNERKEIGVIAQEIQAQFPEIVHTTEDDFLTVDYSRLGAILIEATNEQQRNIEMFELMSKGVEIKLKENSRRIASLEEENENLKIENEKLKLRLDRIEKALGL